MRTVTIFRILETAKPPTAIAVVMIDECFVRQSNFG
jgi:hypothetical protein